MCGRFTARMTWEEIVRLYRITRDQPPRNVQPRYNICPTDPVDVVVSNDGKRMLAPMRWGLIPNWWSKPLKEMKVATFNARGETVAEKPIFRESFERKRCLIPASGYYEWTNTPDGKQPYYFTRRDGQPITIASLWDRWYEKPTGEVMHSCTMVITTPNEFVAEVHDRMPVILEAKEFEQWERGNPKDAAALMKPASEDVLQRSPVSKRVNSSKAPADDASLIEIDGSVATSDEIMAATMSLVHGAIWSGRDAWLEPLFIPENSLQHRQAPDRPAHAPALAKIVTSGSSVSGEA
jgi:putative SOS response-associated peptidase YedK